MLAADWHPADAVTVRSSVHIAESVLLGSQVRRLPSGQQPVPLGGANRIWLFESNSWAIAPASGITCASGKALNRLKMVRPTRLGAATFDHSVGIEPSHWANHASHWCRRRRRARDNVLNTLIAADELITNLSGHAASARLVNGRNGGGDRYFTDGEVTIGVISPNNVPSEIPPIDEPNPVAVASQESLLVLAA